VEFTFAIHIMRLAISFDYDSPEGYRRSFGMKSMPADSDQKGTDALLDVLHAYGVRATFGVVGRVALDGEPPEHCPEQVQRIHAAGHEVASHSMLHRFLPSLHRGELFEDVSSSRQALENRISARVRGFIPPFNRPMHFPQRRAFSVSEVLGLHGRGRGRQSLGSMLRVLREAGYGWSRVSFQDKLNLLLRKAGLARVPLPAQPFLYRGIVAIPLHSGGFGDESRRLVQRYIGTDLTLAIYGHPNQAFEPNAQNAEQLARFLEWCGPERSRNSLQFHTMGEIEDFTRAAGAHS
jgi:peptidoglycan/xylan/chitin deacetylase (PgdA/CDA1 family)